MAAPSVPVNEDVAIANLTNLFDALMGTGSETGLLDTIAAACGLYFVIRGLMMYRSFAQNAGGASRGPELAGPLVHIIIGIVLLNIQGTKTLTLNTMGLGGDLTNQSLAYINNSAGEQWEKISTILGKYISLIGYVAFLRGWFILAKMGHPGAQPGSVGKGITHIVGGLFLVNFTTTASLLAQLVGLT